MFLKSSGIANIKQALTCAGMAVVKQLWEEENVDTPNAAIERT